MNRRRPTITLLAAIALGGLLTVAVAQDQGQAPALPPAEARKLSADQVDQLVAPIALYPDPLLMQVLMASTYPLEVVEADRWRQQNASLTGDALDKALEAKDWDPSVEGLTHFPDLLKRMSDNLDWTKDLGDTFLDQKDDLFDSIQRMRGKAQAAGALQSSKEQTVTKEVVNDKATIVIQPASPDTVYVPQYAPQAYGPTYAAAPPAYPAVYGYTPGQMMATSFLSFGVGVGVGALISNGCDWGHHDVYVNNNYYGGGGKGGGNTNVNINKNVNRNVNRGTWQHNPQHRRDVGYRNPQTAQRYGQRDPAAARNRDFRQDARGYDRGNRGGAGAGGWQGGQRPGGGPNQPGGGGSGRPGAAGGGRPGGGARPETRPAQTASRDAFGGYGNGRDTRQASQRGASSRGGQSWAGAGGGGARGGGGGGLGGGGGRGGGGGGGRGGGGGGRGGGGRRR